MQKLVRREVKLAKGVWNLSQNALLPEQKIV